MTALETQLLFARTVLIVAMFTFLAVVALVAWRDLRAAGRSAGDADFRSDAPRAVIIDPGESGRAAGTWFSIGAVASFGRELDNDVVLQDPTISARHAIVLGRDGGWWIEDLGSTNGSWVGGRRVAPGTPAVVRSGDVIQLGGVRLRFAAPDVDRERAG